ncbi:MAG: hypothetical protein CVV50_04525 [Spirochaetae bacterium HGW-Spirochaetae-6]|nr:MAG: hypothetical protein CVV50_04525 [Spirochaetae bacterium HGW-Spirochaetae-6]
MKHKAFILIALVSLTLGSCGALEDNTATGSLTLTVTGATPNRPYRARLLHHTSLYSGYKKTGNTTASGGISTTYSGVPIGDATLFIAIDNDNDGTYEIGESVYLSNKIYIGGSETLTVSSFAPSDSPQITIKSTESASGTAYCGWLPMGIEPRISFFAPEQIVTITSGSFTSGAPGTGSANTVVTTNPNTSTPSYAAGLYPGALYNVFCFIDKAPANFLPDYSIEYAGSFYFVNSSTPYEFNLNEEFVQ